MEKEKECFEQYNRNSKMYTNRFWLHKKSKSFESIEDMSFDFDEEMVKTINNPFHIKYLRLVLVKE